MSITSAGPPVEPQEDARSGASHGRADRVFAGLARSAGLIIVLALAGVFVFLLIEGLPGVNQSSAIYRNLTGAQAKTSFGSLVAALVFGTVFAAVIALIIAVPFAIGIALFIAIYAPRRIATPVGYLIDLLAAVPSVVYDLWGLKVLAPHLVPVFVWMNHHLSWIPLFSGNQSAVGKTMLTAGIVLAIMILPIMTAIMREIFGQTPRLNQEAAMALGATKWEMVRLTVFPYARSGMVSAVMLGLGRALGETMAVAIVLSATVKVSFRITTDDDNSSTIAAFIASKYSESTPEVLHVLIGTGLILFAITFVVNFAARWVVARSGPKAV